MFEEGRSYTRDQIHAAMGGSKQACLVTNRGSVVAVCFVPEMNPKGPGQIFVGVGPRKERAAAILAAQATPVPVFEKNGTSDWRYRGEYRGERYVSPPAGLEQGLERSVDHQVAGILYLVSI